MEGLNTNGSVTELQEPQEGVEDNRVHPVNFESIPEWSPPPEMKEAYPNSNTHPVPEAENPKDEARFDETLEEQNDKMAKQIPEGDIPRNTPPPVYNDEKDKVKEVVDINSFWLAGNYKKIVKQVEDGSKFCDEFSQMLLERAEIESLYAKKLKAWNKKWLGSLAKGLEYGSLLGSVRGGLEESNDMADLHLAMQGKLAEVCNNVQSWKAENYHKGITGLKEAKKVEDGFNKGQKPWAKKYDDTLKSKQAYHSSRQLLDMLESQKEDLKAKRETTTQDQLMKIENKLKKGTQDKETALENYKEALRDIGNYNNKYKEDMEYEYEKWQSMESKRKNFIIEKMTEYRDSIDISRFQTKLADIYTRMMQAHDAANTSKDLEWFRANFGPDMPFIKVPFVEYDPELNGQSKGKEKLDQNQNPDLKTTAKTKEKSKVCVAL